MAVFVRKTAQRCKFCSSPHRVEIDALLERRARGEEDAEGNRINLAYVLARLEQMGVENPTADNIKSHWGSTEKHHSYLAEERLVEQAAAAEVERNQEAVRVFERVLGADWRTVTPTPEQLLELQRALFPFELLERIKSGKPLGITWDQLDRGINTSTRRHQEEKVGELIGSLAGAIEQSAKTAGKAIDALADQNHGDGEVVEAEVVPVGELGAG